MILGMSLSTFTLVHVAISLIGLAAGFIALYGMLRSLRMELTTAIFLAATVLTSATGFLFPFEKVLPSHVVGVLSLLLLAVALYAYYAARLAGSMRWIYVVTAVAALYLNAFVAAAQAFLKIPALKVLAPTGSEPPFLIAEGVVLIAFIAAGALAVKKFHPEATAVREGGLAVS